MTEKQEPIYVGIGKNIKTQYGDLLKLSLTAEHLETLKANLSNGWVNLVVKERREPSEKGTTHYLEVDQFSPDKNYKKDEVAVEEDVSDLPF